VCQAVAGIALAAGCSGAPLDRAIVLTVFDGEIVYQG